MIDLKRRRQCSPRFEILPVFRRLEVDQGWEQQDHISSFVHDRCTAISTADFARQFVYGCLFRTLIPTKVVMTLGEVDVFFVKDSCPLEWCSYSQGVSI